MNKCKHYFHKDCIEQWFQKGKPTCPMCGTGYGVIIGPQPPGRMTIMKGDYPCEGYKCGTITVRWEIFSGVQTEKHQNPGRAFYGDSRNGFLPDNEEGREILELFKIIWERRHMFSVGRSVTRGQDNVVVWNGIHAKTNTCGGSSSYGYPDPGYFGRVKAEMAAKGVTVDDIKGKANDEGM